MPLEHVILSIIQNSENGVSLADICVQILGEPQSEILGVIQNLEAHGNLDNRVSLDGTIRYVVAYH